MQTETLPLDTECCIDGVSLPAGEPHVYMRSDGDNPVAGALCDDCAKIVRKLGVDINGTAGPTALRLDEIVLLDAQDMLRDCHGHKKLNVASKALERYGWAPSMVSEWKEVSRDDAKAGATLYLLFGIRHPSAGPCTFCDSTDVEVYLDVGENGVLPFCIDCASIIVRMAKDGWVDPNCIPSPTAVGMWLRRFHPDEIERISRSIFLHHLEEGMTCVAVVKGVTLHGVLSQAEDGTWMCDGTPLMTADGDPLGGVERIMVERDGGDL